MSEGNACCEHGLIWHHDTRGCGYSGYAPEHKCPCDLTFTQALAAHDAEARAVERKATGERIAVAMLGDQHQTLLSISNQEWVCEPAHCGFTLPLFDDAGEAADIVVADRAHAARIARADTGADTDERECQPCADAHPMAGCADVDCDHNCQAWIDSEATR